jgi:cation diffusion facilitator family transporter
MNAVPHSHDFNPGNAAGERKTLIVTLITAAMMVVEIIGGYTLNSMALLADGWHMSSHALAMGLSLVAYVLARRYARDTRFAFGTWKIEILGGFSSALLLAGVAALMLFQSAERLFSPSAIHYDEAIVIAVIGLVVNLVCAWLLRDDHDHHGHSHGHSHGHGHGHGHQHAESHGHGHHDVNLRSAYIHVIADAATSVLAILALFGGKLYGAAWLDPLMGVVGAVLVARWAVGLMRESGRILLDAEMDAPVVEEIRDVVRDELPGARIADLHVWRVARGSYACILALHEADGNTPEDVRRKLSIHEELVHVTVEIDRHIPRVAA